MCIEEGCTVPAFCRERCRKHYRALHYVENREKILAKNREYRAAKPEMYRAADKARRLANIEAERARDRARYAANPNRNRNQQLRAQYGMSLEDYERMLQEQSGRCAICPSEVGAKGKSLAVDHCHETGRVRGLLCARCNVGIGMFQDDVSRLRNAIEYLNTPAKGNQPCL
jgi:hypothetical protein